MFILKSLMTLESASADQTFPTSEIIYIHNIEYHLALHGDI